MKKNRILYITLVLALGLSSCSSPYSSKSYIPEESIKISDSQQSETKTEQKTNEGQNQSPANAKTELENSQWHFKNPNTGQDEAPNLVNGRWDPNIDINEYGNEEYLEIIENKETKTAENPLLTFSLKVDTASYGNIVRYINSGNLPPVDAIKIEEMINYFNYDEILKENDSPFSLYTEIGKSPFNENKNLAFIRVKSKDIDKKELQKSNFTFLIDTSGSMDSYDKLPLLKSAFGLLVENLNENDKVSIVTYAGSSFVVLDSATGDQKEKIINAINNLESGGSTGGAEGITTAYKLAAKNFVEGGNNRVILATDGDFNVGPSSISELEKLIAEKRDTGVYLSVLGFGTENLKDNTMETLSKNGNGNYGYIDSISSAKKILVDELSSNLFTIADDVKAQVEFNTDLVSNYRLIGYENRRLENKDFENDKKDAGEIGIGTDVVLLFELELNNDSKSLKYKEESNEKSTNKYTDELFEVRIRYKIPGESESILITEPVKTDRILVKNTNDFNFSASVSAFGHILRNSDKKGNVTFESIFEMAKDSIGKDKGGYRKEFIDILKKYEKLK